MGLLRLLGSPEYETQNGVLPLRPTKPLMVLAYLALAPGWVSRDQLSALIWPQASASAGLSRFRQMIHQLGEEGWSVGLEVERLRVRWTKGSDVHELQQALQAEDWHQAVRLYRGPLLAGLALEDQDPYSDWLRQERSRLRDRWLQVAPQAALLLEQEGRLTEAMHLWEAVLQEDGLAEAVLCSLLRACLVSGQYARGFGAYGKFQQRLKAEFGLEPQAETLVWLERLREAAGEADPGPQVELAEAELDQSLPEYAAGAPFIGREAEIEGLVAWLNRDDPNRILTLFGPGGIGKTRLAVEAVRRSPRFSAFVPLLTLHPGQSVAAAVAQALGSPLRGAKAPEQELRDQLLGRPAVLVLDNAEHLIPELSFLLDALSDLSTRFLITSRVRLDHPLEQAQEVGGLGLEGQGANQSAALKLLFHTVRKARPGFVWTAYEAELGQQICRAVGGAPLAIELAGSWTRLLSLTEVARQIEQGLDFLEGSAPDLPERHRGLRAVFEHSWRLLSETERTALCRLSVFESGFEVGAGLEVAQIRHQELLALTDKALLRVLGEQQRRCDVHPLILEYAREQVSSSDKNIRLERHARYFLGFAEEASPKLRGPEQVNCLERVNLEHPNLRKALEWFCSQQQALEALRLAAALHWFWYVRGHYREGLTWMERCLALPNVPEVCIERAEVLRCAGALSCDLGEYEKAGQYLGDALALFQQLENKSGIAHTWHHLGIVAREQGNLGLAQSHLEQSIAAHRALSDTDWLATSLNDLAIVLAYSDKAEQARHFFEESLTLKQAVGDHLGVAYAYNNLAAILDELGQPFETTQPLYEKSLLIKRQLHDLMGLATTLHNLGERAREARDPSARGYLLEALSRFHRLGYRLKIAQTLAVLAQLLADEGQFEKAASISSFVQHMAQQHGFMLNPKLQETMRKLDQNIQHNLGQERTALAQASGEVLSLEQIIKLVE